MLSILTAKSLEPEVEAIDRDPGIITLAARIVDAIRRTSRAGFARRCETLQRTGTPGIY